MNSQTESIESKVGLLHLTEQFGNVSQASKLFGYSRDRFYRLEELYDHGGELALQELNRRTLNLKKMIEEEVRKR